MKELVLSNSYYKIEKNLNENILYLTIFKNHENYKLDKNIVNNILSHFMMMERGFNLILDFRFFAVGENYEWFQENINRIAKRMNELDAGEQAHILNDFFWEVLWSEVPYLYGIKPLIIIDELTKKPIGRFDEIGEAEMWLRRIKNPYDG